MHIVFLYKCLSLILLSSFSILFSFNSQASALSCNTKSVNTFIESKTIRSIDITTPKSKKWAKNYFKALKDPSEDILRKYKKKFDADITILFDNDLECNFPAKIRINGDHKDHLSGAPLVTSLDVKLLAGNINSIVKFKLFLPHTKGGDNEVFSTALLRELGFLAPQTYHIPSIFNGQKVVFLFQEKITKEFIESNNFREAPILEGDERFLFANDVVAFDRFGLARVVNKNWTKKGETSLDISKVALSQLNKSYLKYLLGKHIKKNRNDRFLRANSLSHERYANKDREFKAILVAIGASHGLRPHNRSFYYDPIYKYFRPIYYDGDTNITTLNSALKHFMYLGNKLNNDEVIGSKFALISFSQLDRNHFHRQLQELGLSYDLGRVNAILDDVVDNLKTISASTIYQTDNSYTPYFSHYKDLKTNKKLVFSTNKDSRIEICDLLLTSCRYDILSIKKYSKLLQGRYSDGSSDEFIFVGDKQEYISGLSDSVDEQKNTFNIGNGVQLIAYGSPNVSINQENRKIELQQNNVNDRILLRKGKLKDWSIKINGLKGGGVNEGQRFNQNLLTGCLTFLDMNIENVNIEVDQALCEDGVNLMRVKGSLNDVVISNALSDAIDVDFSVLRFKNIKVNIAGNDCVDLSAGNYYIHSADLRGCNDKAVSVGEGSKLSIDSIQVSNSDMGVVAKDSSIVKVGALTIDSVATCFAAYNKKQEFWGGKITANEHNCQLDQVFQQEGSLVEIVQ